MLVLTVDVPEPFRSCLDQDTPGKVCDAEATAPEALFGRAMARVAAGREAEARQDLEAALPGLGDPCRVELALLDLRQRDAVKDAVVVAQLVVDRAEPKSALAARALHVVGLAEGKLRHTSVAADALLKAAEIYGVLEERAGLAQVYDTLGTLEAARGRLDNALHFYALSLVDKTLLGDRPGMAITLGNLGRVHLRAGRFRDALLCFQRDLMIARELDDVRGQARMHEDLGRAYLGLEQFDEAEEELAKCLEIAAEYDFKDMKFFARKDLVLARIGQGRLREAETELAAADVELPAQAEPYFRLVLAAVRGSLLLAKGRRSAVEVLEEAVEGFEKMQLPDLEIPARVLLAKAFVKQKYKALAEQCLLRGLRLARSDGYARYLPTLNEAMAELELVEGVIEETARPVGSGPALPNNSYVIREQLGKGAYGEVFRAYDPQRGRDVALKRLRLSELYDVKHRKRILDSARVELEAASRVRHPGVVRVLALGSEPDGGAYVVQEYIPGKSLREFMAKDGTADPYLVVSYLQLVANALQVLHEAGVIHRDLKPENIIIREDDLPVLVDFGIAHMADAGAAKARHVTGTLPYMSPEQAMCKRITGRADLYSLGAIAYEWLAGVRPVPIRRGSLDEMVKDIATREPPPLSDFRPEISADLEQMIMSMLAKKPRQRPQTALAVAEQLGKLYEGKLLRPGSDGRADSRMVSTEPIDPER